MSRVFAVIEDEHGVYATQSKNPQETVTLLSVQFDASILEDSGSGLTTCRLKGFDDAPMTTPNKGARISDFTIDEVKA